MCNPNGDQPRELPQIQGIQSAEQVVQHLLMVLGQNQIVTLTWNQFRDLNGVVGMPGMLGVRAVRDAAFEIGIIVGYGLETVLIATDENHHPLEVRDA